MAQKSSIEHLFNQTVDRYMSMIRRICLTYSTPRMTVDDLYQEVLTAIWLGLKSFSGKSALSTWVYRVAINSCISALRRHENRTLFADEMIMESLPEDTSTYGKDDFECLRYLIGQLGALDKAIILMWLDDFSYNEISEVTGLSKNVVGTRLSRIRTQLKTLWDKELNQ